MTRLSNRDARRLFLHLHGLSDPPGRRLDRAGLMDLIRRIGFVQVDSIATVERAHHMILFSRAQGYRPEMLEAPLERERLLFENWTHDASIIPVEHYPHWKPRFARARERIPERWKDWQGTAFVAEVDHVLAHLRENGPSAPADLGGAREGPGGWWNWSPRKAALEYLWLSGEIAVARRQGFTKIYDLAERVLPDHHPLPEPEPEDHLDWACSGALERLGFATTGEIRGFWGAVTPEEAKAWAEARAGELEEVRIACTDGAERVSLARPGLAERAAAAPEAPERMRVLSPFDPILRNRDRALRLFGFDYRIEIYVPAERRRYGYYVFPLLEGDGFVGRVDMKADRAAGVLRVAALWPEAGVRFGKGRLERLEAELERVARFARCERVEFVAGWMRG